MARKLKATIKPLNIVNVGDWYKSTKTKEMVEIVDIGGVKRACKYDNGKIVKTYTIQKMDENEWRKIDAPE